MTAILATTKSLRTTVDGTLVVSFEIAPQDAPAAFTAFGLTGTNVGIAPITDDAARDATVRAASTVSGDPIKRTSEPEPLTKEEHRQRFTELKRTAQAAIRCSEPDFWQFLRRMHGWDVIDKDSAALAVRSICNVLSRADFNTNQDAAARWDALEGTFYAWTHGMH